MDRDREEAGETVKTTTTKKTAPFARPVQVIVVKEGQSTGMGPRLRYEEALLGSVAKLTGGTFRDLANVYILDAVLPEGDPRWALDNVYKRHDMFNITSTVASARMADMMADELKALPDHLEMTGVAVVRTMLDRVYARYDIIVRDPDDNNED